MGTCRYCDARAGGRVCSVCRGTPAERARILAAARERCAGCSRAPATGERLVPVDRRRLDGQARYASVEALRRCLAAFPLLCRTCRAASAEAALRAAERDRRTQVVAG